MITLSGQAGVTGVFNGAAVTVFAKPAVPAPATGTVTPNPRPESVSLSPTVVQTPAQYNDPSAIAVDGLGDIFVMDTGNYVVREIDDSGLVSILAGQAGVPGLRNGPVTQADFRKAYGIAVDDKGDLYVADSENNVIREITKNKKVISLAGSGVAGGTNGVGTEATFWGPRGVAVDRSGNVYVADTNNHMIRKIDNEGRVKTLAGSGVVGSDDGRGVTASFNGPTGIALDEDGNVYVADRENELIRKIDGDGRVTTLAGQEGRKGSIDGPVTMALFNHPTGISVDPAGNVYVADEGNHTVRKISRSGVVSTLAGKAGKPGAVNATGQDASFRGPMGVAANAWGNVIVADTGNQLIRMIR